MDRNYNAIPLNKDRVIVFETLVTKTFEIVDKSPITLSWRGFEIVKLVQQITDPGTTGTLRLFKSIWVLYIQGLLHDKFKESYSHIEKFNPVLTFSAQSQ